MPRSKPKLVVVSNRGPFRTVTLAGKRRQVRAAGGLVAALDPVLRQRGGVWVSAEEGEGDAASVAEDGDKDGIGYTTPTVPLSRSDREGFYQGVSNAMLWPILHSLQPTVRIGPAPWRGYERANAAFCEAVLRSSRPRDLVWVHDFHLMLLPAMLRAKRARARVGWFCHTPWPGDDLFKILPWRSQILEGLLGADLLGFHTTGYVTNFLDCVEVTLKVPVDRRRGIVKWGGRSVRVMVAPVGVPVDDLQALAADPRVAAHAQNIRDGVGGRRVVLGVDRLDYTKGIPQRLLAFERLLRNDRSARNRYVMVQIMVPSRTDVKAYAELKLEIDRLVGDINGRYASAGRIPIQYIYRNLPLDQLLAHYLAADVALVTPLRDGMNLVALEFCTARIDGGGVLVLSEFAGAANYLAAALTVNPYDIDGMADTMLEALSLGKDAAHQRMQSLRAAVRKLDVHRWADDYLSALEQRD